MQGDQCKFLDEKMEKFPCPHYGCWNHCHKHPHYGLEKCAQCGQWKVCALFCEDQDVSDGEYCEFNTTIEISVCKDCLKEAWEELTDKPTLQAKLVQFIQDEMGHIYKHDRKIGFDRGKLLILKNLENLLKEEPRD